MQTFNSYHTQVCKALSRRGIQYMEEYPIGPYSVDIYLPEIGRLVELDGPGHWRKKDKARTLAIMRLRPDLGEIVRIKVGTPIREALEVMLHETDQRYQETPGA